MSAARIYDGFHAIAIPGEASLHGAFLRFVNAQTADPVALPLKRIRHTVVLDDELHIEFKPIGSGFEEFEMAELAVEGMAGLFALKYSRDMETEADMLGMQKLIMLRKNPRGMISFFEAIQNIVPDPLLMIEDELQFLSTHPSSTERMVNMEKMVRKNYYDPVPWLLPHDWRSTPQCP